MTYGTEEIIAAADSSAACRKLSTVFGGWILLLCHIKADQPYNLLTEDDGLVMSGELRPGLRSGVLIDRSKLPRVEFHNAQITSTTIRDKIFSIEITSILYSLIWNEVIDFMN